MAKHLDNVKIFFTSANTEFESDSVRAEYRICDGRLSAHDSWVVSGIDMSQSVSGFFANVVSEIETLEGI